ncbi:MAG: TolC family outer membrane protein [Rhizobiaceae bacterium]|nr:TolC family outer membrane protein [Rhizobiaceae bacterium]
MFPVRRSFAGVFALALALTLSAPVSAETISGALAKAYRNNSSLNSQRAGTRVTDENVAIAKSGYRPTIGASSGLTFSRTSAGGGRSITSGSFGIEINQMIFDGFQTRNNVLAAEANVRASQQALRNTVQNTLFDAASAYMDVIRDRQIAALRQRNLEFLEEQVRAARSRFEVGEGTRTDVAQAEAVRQSAIAQLSAARAQVLASEALYRQIIGEDPGSLSGAAPLSHLLPRSVDEGFNIALASHPAIMASEHLVDAAAFTVKSSEGALLPRLSASAGVSRSFTNGVPASPTDGASTSASIGAALTVPIYQGGRASATVRRSKESLGQARINVDVSRDQVRAAVASAWAQYQASRESVAANREVVAAGQLALNGVIEERNVGQRTTLDVLNAQADVNAAQINLASSERDVVVASYAILSAVGRLTVGQLGLGVEEYDPEEHFLAVKDKWFGLRTPDGR